MPQPSAVTTGISFFIAVDLAEPGLFHVEHLAPQRQDGLEFPVASALGGTACGIALDDVNLGFLRVTALAVRQLAGQGGIFQRGFPPHHFARLFRGLTRARRRQRLVENSPGCGGFSSR